MIRFTLLSCIAACALLLASCQSGGGTVKIGYVQITQDPVLDQAKAGVFQALADSGFINGQNIKILDNNAQGDLSMINMILQSLLTQNTSLIITNSTPCMAAAAQTVRNIPVVFTVAFGPEQIGMTTVPENLHGIYDPLLTDKYADLLLECLPSIRRIGIPFNNAEPNARYSVEVLSKELESRGITIVTAAVNSSNEILQAGQYLAGQNIGALLVAADNTVYLGVPLLAKIAGEQKIPFFVTDALQTEKGAAVGFGVNYGKWGYLSGLKAVEVLKGRSTSGSRIEPIRVYDLIINRQACADQGLVLPESVLQRASRIIN
jgi:putative ABC transport system substrate-binding protein